MERVSQFMDSHYDPSWSHRFTALVADTEAVYGIARMYEALVDLVPIEVGVFREIEQAQAWLREKVADAAAGPSRVDVS
jgi:hypothetical protein